MKPYPLVPERPLIIRAKWLYFSVSIISSTFIYILFATEPALCLFLIDLVLCANLAWLFKSRLKYLLFLHPFIMLVSGNFFHAPFLEGGDGLMYGGVVDSYTSSENGLVDSSSIIGGFSQLGIISFLKFASLGAIPVFILPPLLFDAPSQEIYYFFQGVLLVLLITFFSVIIKSWRVIPDNLLFSIVCFSIISPTFFELGVAPTRHYLTYIGLFVFISSYIALIDRYNLNRFIWFSFAILLTAISKMAYLPLMLAFIISDQILIRKIRLTKQAVVFSALVLVFVFVFLGGYVVSLFNLYSGISEEGGNRLGYLATVPVLGSIFKYIFALLAPFPWHEVSAITAESYSGNYFIFVMHILSSLFGLYFFSVAALRYRTIRIIDTTAKTILLFGFMMTLSIVFGSTGFHGYIAIFFPFMAPLLLYKPLRILPVIPIGFAVLAQLIIIVVN